MAYVAKVKNGNSNIPVGHTLYGTCSTAANEAAKVVTMPDFSSLVDGVTIKVAFTNSNTASNPTLNVNSTGAKNIYRYGTTRPGTTTETSWEAGSVLSFTYDGNSWMMNDFQNGSGGTGHGIPAGGTANQILTKNSGTDYDASWEDKPSYTAGEVGALPLNGKASTAGIADSVGNTLYMGAIGANGWKKRLSFNGSEDIRHNFARIICSIETSNWSANPDAYGYYMIAVNFRVIVDNVSTSVPINTYYPLNVKLIGADLNTLPTSAEIAAANCIDYCYLNDGVAGYIQLFAKTKPTTSFNICVEGYTHVGV